MRVIVDARACIQVVKDSGSSPFVRCGVCDEFGYLNNKLGYPHNSKTLKHHLIHKKTCPIGKRLPKKGK